MTTIHTPLRLLEEALQTYTQAALDEPESDPHQRLATRRAFLTGAFSLWHIMAGLREQPDALQAMGMGAIEAELRVFEATLGSTLEGLV